MGVAREKDGGFAEGGVITRGEGKKQHRPLAGGEREWGGGGTKKCSTKL